MAEYQCWGDDHEDLTERVEQAIAALPSKGVITYGITWTGSDKRPPRQVMVVCAKGHENVFAIED